MSIAGFLAVLGLCVTAIRNDEDFITATCIVVAFLCGVLLRPDRE